MEKAKKGTKPLNQKSLKISSQDKEAKINPIRNSSGSSPRRPAATVREHGGSGSGHAGGALKPAAGQRSIISNGVNNSYRESESIYKKLVEASLQGIVIAQGIPPRLIYANPAISRILLYSPDELTSLTPEQIESLIHPDDRLKFFSQYKDRLEGKSVGPSYEIRAIRKDGSTVWLELSATQIEYNGEPAVLATYVDITERKQAEEALVKNQSLLENVLDTLPIGVWITDKGGKIISGNPVGHRIWGGARYVGINQYGEYKGWWADSGKKIEGEEWALARAITKGETSIGEVIDIECFDGSRKTILNSAVPIRDRNQEMMGAIVVNQDITERRRAEEALRSSEEMSKRIALENAVMAEIGRIVSSTLNIEEVYERLAGEVHKLIPFEGIAINMINHKEGTVTVPYVSGMAVPGCQPGDFPLEGSVTGEVLRTHSGVIIQTEDRKELQTLFPTLLKAFETGLRSVMAVPLISKYQVIGAIHFRSTKPNAYSDQNLKLAEDIASQIVGAITNGQLFIEHKQTEEALRSEHDKFRGMLSALGDGVDIINKNYIIEFQNELLRERYGDKIGEKCFSTYMGLERPCDFCSIQEAIRTGHPTRIELVAPDGGNYELNSSPFRDVDGEVKVIELVRDITERKQAEEALRKSEEKYRLVSENIPVAVYSALPDEHSTNLFISGKMEELTGYPGHQLIEDPELWMKVIHPEDRERVWREIEKHRRERKPLDIEYRLITRDNITKWIKDKAIPALNEKGEIIRIDGFMEDITEYKRAEAALQQSEERYRTLVEESFDGIFIRKGPKIVFANRRLYEMLGYEEGELEGLNHWLVYHPDYQALIRERSQARMRGESVPFSYEVKFLRKGGSSFWGEIHPKVISFLGEPGIQVWARDISERKQTEETLRAERERFRSLSENAPFGMAMIDKEGAFKYVNPKFKELFGYDLNDVPDGKTWFRKAYPDPDYRHQVISEWLDDLKSFKSGEKRSRIFTVTCKDGAQKNINFIPVQLETGENLMACEDITERKRAEEALRESEERYRTILENIEDGYYEVDLPGNLTFFNDSLCRMLGYSRDEMIGMGNQQYTDEENRKKLFQAFKEVYKTGEPTKGFDWKMFRKDGKELFGEVSVSLVKDSKGQPIGFRGIARDITERKQAEEALRRSEESSRELAKENAIMAEIGRIISSTLNIDEVYERFSEEVNKLIPFDRIAINILDPNKNTVTVAYGNGVDVPDRRG